MNLSVFKLNKFFSFGLKTHQYTANLALTSNLNRYYSSTSEETPTEDTEKPAEDSGPKERIFFKEQEIIDGFKVFDPYMNKRRASFERSRKSYKRLERDQLARYNRMSTDQDWTNVWPTSSMFKQSSVPLPVRQGFIKNLTENDGLPPEKYGNVELIKIPNFLHLTPPHIKKHCEVLKEFCTEWPKELDIKDECSTYFPIEITTSNYIYDGPSLRDDRAREVILKFKLSSLGLNERAADKFKRLVGERYNHKNDLVTITANRCPYRNQNEDYAMYLLKTLYFESQQIEEWEKEADESDLSTVIWSKSKSKDNISNLISKIEKKNLEEKDLTEISKVKEYSESFQTLFNKGEDRKNLEAYKKSVLNLLKIKQLQTDSASS